MGPWIYIIVCVGMNCPWGVYYNHLGGLESKPACEDAADLKIMELSDRYGLKEHTFFSGCANRG